MLVLYFCLLLCPLFVLCAPYCRCLSSDSCWPSESDFARLSSLLSHPFVYPVPPASVCYPSSSPSGNCTDFLLNTDSGIWRADHPGAMQAPNFESYIFPNGSVSACYGNTSLGISCEQGSISTVGVDAYTIEDIRATVLFAAEHNLRLVIKTTGHDFLGRSSARGSLLLWTHHLKNITYDEAFVPLGAPSQITYKAFTLGSGVQWREAYVAAISHQRLIVGGDTGSVGAAGGWVMGGGHSPLSPHHGLGVDNVLQFTIVTSSGDHLTVSSYSYPDLFWALRGGGGGTFGVLTSVTYRTHDPTPVIGAYINATFATNSTARSVLTKFAEIQPALSDAGWGGNSFIYPQSLYLTYVLPNETVSLAQANASIGPFFEFLQNTIRPGEGTVQTSLVLYDSYYSWFAKTESLTGDDEVGRYTQSASRLLPRALFEEDATGTGRTGPERIADTILELGSAAWFLNAGGLVSKVPTNSMGLTPAWRSALVHVLVGEAWTPGAPETSPAQIESDVKKQLVALRELAGFDSGAYLNEASMYESDPHQVFFGEHYPQLKLIKEKYDPQGLFVVVSGVGSEEWDESLNCRLW